MSKRTAMVVLSGGQDSTTCLWWAKKNFDEVHAISFDYGQRHSVELQAAEIQARLAGTCSFEVVRLGASILSGRSPLTNAAEVLEQYADYASMEAAIGDRVELTFVPMRNALFLTLAANRAICLGVQDLVTGVCEADNANYPDCRHAFIRSQADTIAQALGTEFYIHTPLITMSKAESIQLAIDQGSYTALAWTHTSYDGTYPPVGGDHATLLRAEGFSQAGVPDPLVVRAWMEGYMSLPDTANYGYVKVLDCKRAIQDLPVGPWLFGPNPVPQGNVGGVSL